MKIHTHSAISPQREQRGVSLIEIMISLAIGLVILAAITTVFVGSNSSRREIDRSANLMENGRYAAESLSEEFKLAGYYGTLSVVSGDTNLPCSAQLSEWSSSLAIHVVGSNQGSSFSCLTDQKANTDAIFIQRVSTCAVGDTGCSAKDPKQAYLQVSECGDEYALTPWVLDLGSKDKAIFALKNLKLVSGSAPICGDAGTAPLRRFYRSFYYVNTASNLMRADISPDGALDTTSIAENIDNMQLEYGFDTNGDGSPDSFSTTPPTSWKDAMGVRIWILAKAPSASPGEANDKSYPMSDVTVTPTDGIKRHVFSTYSAFINPTGKRFK